MALPGVAQAQLLARIFAGMLDRYAPESIAALGCAGGNGFDSISPATTQRVVGVDLNPDYIAQARARYEGRFRSLELHVADIQQDTVAIKPVDFVFAALILEYVDVNLAIARIRAMLAAGGKLVTVVQLPNASAAYVTPSPFTSLRALGDVMRLVSPTDVSRAVEASGCVHIESNVADSAGGKRFQVQVFEATGRPR